MQYVIDTKDFLPRLTVLTPNCRYFTDSLHEGAGLDPGPGPPERLPRLPRPDVAHQLLHGSLGDDGAG